MYKERVSIDKYNMDLIKSLVIENGNMNDGTNNYVNNVEDSEEI
jgi:hypothetical protein